MNDRKIIYILIAVNIFLALMIHKQRAYLVHLNRRQMKDIKELGETFKEEMEAGRAPGGFHEKNEIPTGESLGASSHLGRMASNSHAREKVQ